MKVVVGWVVALLVVIGVGIGVEAALGVRAGFFIPGGNQTVRLLINGTHSQRPTYSGTVAGKPLSGELIAVTRPMNTRCFDLPGPAAGPAHPFQFAYAGSYNGQQYTFAGCLTLSVGAVTAFAFSIRGQIASVPFAGSTRLATPSTLCMNLTEPTPQFIKECDTFPFSGVVGSESITGSVALIPMKNGYRMVGHLIAS